MTATAPAYGPRLPSTALAARLLDSGPDGQWTSAFAGDADLGAPNLVGDESASIVRRRETPEANQSRSSGAGAC